MTKKLMLMQKAFRTADGDNKINYLVERLVGPSGNPTIPDLIMYGPHASKQTALKVKEAFARMTGKDIPLMEEESLDYGRSISFKNVNDDTETVLAVSSLTDEHFRNFTDRRRSNALQIGEYPSYEDPAKDTEVYVLEHDIDRWDHFKKRHDETKIPRLTYRYTPLPPWYLKARP